MSCSVKVDLPEVMVSEESEVSNCVFSAGSDLVMSASSLPTTSALPGSSMPASIWWRAEIS
jgi:hypothetical protein